MGMIDWGHERTGSQSSIAAASRNRNWLSRFWEIGMVGRGPCAEPPLVGSLIQVVLY